MLKGSIVALVTPMTPNGELDLPALKNLVDWHIQAGTHALVLLGSTGEGVTLQTAEKKVLLETALQHAKGQIPIIAGTGSNSTAQTIEQTLMAKALGAVAALVVAPYYNKPTQEGMFLHYKKIAEDTNFPIILYNVPSRTASDLLPATVARLSQIPNIIGIKEATGDLKRLENLKEHCRPGFLLYSGDDASAMDFILQGGDGVISVCANILPDLWAKMCTAALNHEVAIAKGYNDNLKTLNQRLYLESNPIPVKWALSWMGKIKVGIRLPLTPLAAEHIPSLEHALQEAGLHAAV